MKIRDTLNVVPVIVRDQDMCFCSAVRCGGEVITQQPEARPAVQDEPRAAWRDHFDAGGIPAVAPHISFQTGDGAANSPEADFHDRMGHPVALGFSHYFNRAYWALASRKTGTPVPERIQNVSVTPNACVTRTSQRHASAAHVRITPAATRHAEALLPLDFADCSFRVALMAPERSPRRDEQSGGPLAP